MDGEDLVVTVDHFDFSPDDGVEVVVGRVVVSAGTLRAETNDASRNR